VFRRRHHQHIELLLSALDGNLLRQQHCFFGGGTAIALCYGEYRESVDDVVKLFCTPQLSHFSQFCHFGFILVWALVIQV